MRYSLLGLVGYVVLRYVFVHIFLQNPYVRISVFVIASIRGGFSSFMEKLCIYNLLN